MVDCWTEIVYLQLILELYHSIFRYSKTIFSFNSESILEHSKCITAFHIKYWEQKPNGRRKSSYITETFSQGIFWTHYMTYCLLKAHWIYFLVEQLSFKIHFQTIKEWQVFVLIQGNAKATDISWRQINPIQSIPFQQPDTLSLNAENRQKVT